MLPKDPARTGIVPTGPRHQIRKGRRLLSRFQRMNFATLSL